jgi:hypothetical protein
MSLLKPGYKRPSKSLPLPVSCVESLAQSVMATGSKHYVLVATMSKVMPKHLRFLYGWLALNEAKYIYTIDAIVQIPGGDSYDEFDRALRLAKRYIIRK